MIILSQISPKLNDEKFVASKLNDINKTWYSGSLRPVVMGLEGNRVAVSIPADTIPVSVTKEGKRLLRSPLEPYHMLITSIHETYPHVEVTWK